MPFRRGARSFSSHMSGVVAIREAMSIKRKREEDPIVEVDDDDQQPPPEKRPKTMSLISVTSAQQAVVDFIADPAEQHRAVFITGGAGSGKSVVIRLIIDRLRTDRRDVGLFITASTGIAASHIGGVTLHTFAGLGMGDKSPQAIARAIQKTDAGERLRTATEIIVDEISMVLAELLDSLDKVARIVRRRPDVPFGGIRLIMVGDVLQLPPVPKERGGAASFFFQSEVWKALKPAYFNLTYSHRQARDPVFAALLEDCRRGIASPRLVTALESRLGLQPPEGEPVTAIMPYNRDVQSINESRLAELRDVPELTFRATDYCSKGPNAKDAGRAFLQLVNAPQVLVLKVGAQVMLTRNLDVHRGLVNGLVGVVTGVDAASRQPIVHFARIGKTITVPKQQWEYKGPRGVVIARRTQVPLTLAWAISTHKSQGQTIKCNVYADLGRAFAPGQIYVVLSRVECMDQLYLASINMQAIRADPRALEFLESIGCI